MEKLDYLFNFNYQLKTNKDINTNLIVYKMKKQYNNYDDYITYNYNGYKILSEDINGETILIKQNMILEYLILYVNDTLKEMRCIYDTIKFIYELKELNLLELILTNKYDDKIKFIYENIEKLNINNNLYDEELIDIIQIIKKFKNLLDEPESIKSQEILIKINNLKLTC